MTTTDLATRKSDLIGVTPHVDYILLDGSSSMSDKWWETLAALDAYIDPIRTQQIDTRVILSIFDSADIDYRARDQKIADFVPLMTDPAGANWGSTPLYDAINIMGRNVLEHDPKTCHIIIATDGGENSSQVTDETQAKAILDFLRAKGYQITFIGAEFNNLGMAAKLGAKREHAIGVTKHHLLDVAKNLAEKRTRYALYGIPMYFTEEERQQFGGYLAAPDNGK